MRFPASFGAWSLLHQGGADRARNDIAVLVAPGVLEGDDAFAGPALRLALAAAHGLRVQRVAVKDRLGEEHLRESRLATMVPSVSWVTDSPTSVERVNIELTSRSPRKPGCSAAHAASRCSDWVFMVNVVNNRRPPR